MGMYTEVMFAAEVDEEAYRVFETYRDSQKMPENHPHLFFSLDRAEMIVGGYGGSYYFPGACGLRLEVDGHGKPIYSVALKANLKNYADEIAEFFDWVTPHVVDGSGSRRFIGYHLYEEDETPTLHYADVADDAGVSS